MQVTLDLRDDEDRTILADGLQVLCRNYVKVARIRSGELETARKAGADIRTRTLQVQRALSDADLFETVAQQMLTAPVVTAPVQPELPAAEPPAVEPPAAAEGKPVKKRATRKTAAAAPAAPEPTRAPAPVMSPEQMADHLATQQALASSEAAAIAQGVADSAILPVDPWESAVADTVGDTLDDDVD